MFGQQRAKNQKPLPQEGFVELSEEQSESVSGGKSGSPGAARYRYDTGYADVLKYGFNAEVKQSSHVTVVNETVNNNNVSARASNTSGVAVKK